MELRVLLEPEAGIVTALGSLAACCLALLGPRSATRLPAGPAAVPG